MCPHRAIVNLPEPSGMLAQCVPIELLYCQPSSTQCDVGPVCVPHKVVVNLLQQCNIGRVGDPIVCQPSVMLVQCVPHSVSTKCDVGPVCAPIVCQPSVMLVQCVPPLCVKQV